MLTTNDTHVARKIPDMYLKDNDATTRQFAVKSLWLIVAEGKAAPLRRGIVLKEDGTMHGFQSMLPAACQAADAKNADIILTLSETKTVLGVYPYTGGPSITRYQHDLRVKLVNQRTKAEVNNTFTTTAPPAPQTAPVDLIALGEPVAMDPVGAWAVQFFFDR